MGETEVTMTSITSPSMREIGTQASPLVSRTIEGNQRQNLIEGNRTNQRNLGFLKRVFKIHERERERFETSFAILPSALTESNID